MQLCVTLGRASVRAGMERERPPKSHECQLGLHGGTAMRDLSRLPVPLDCSASEDFASSLSSHHESSFSHHNDTPLSPQRGDPTSLVSGTELDRRFALHPTPEEVWGIPGEY